MLFNPTDNSLGCLTGGEVCSTHCNFPHLSRCFCALVMLMAAETPVRGTAVAHLCSMMRIPPGTEY
jgi:hypothetical protein